MGTRPAPGIVPVVRIDLGEAPTGERRLGGHRATCAVSSAPAYARGCRLLVTVLCSAFSKPAFSR